MIRSTRAHLHDSSENFSRNLTNQKNKTRRRINMLFPEKAKGKVITGVSDETLVPLKAHLAEVEQSGTKKVSLHLFFDLILIIYFISSMNFRADCRVCRFPWGPLDRWKLPKRGKSAWIFSPVRTLGLTKENEGPPSWPRSPGNAPALRCPHRKLHRSRKTAATCKAGITRSTIGGIKGTPGELGGDPGDPRRLDRGRFPPRTRPRPRDQRNAR